MDYMLEAGTLVQVAKSILNSLEFGTLDSHKAQKLKGPVYSICQLLLAVDKNWDSEGVASWVWEVSKALYEASDLVDEAAATAGLAASSLVSKVRFRSLFGLSTSSTSMFGVRIIGPVINRLCEELSQLKQEAPDSLGLEKEHVDATLTMEPHPVVTTDIRDEVVIGRSDDREKIIGKLLDTSDLNNPISVVSILGVGGLGKTTLAKLIYNDKIIIDHFDLKVWEVVSEEFDIPKILKQIISSCSSVSSKVNALDMNQLIDLFQSEISGKLYFLVLDDLWNESREKWQKLMDLLKVGARGSKILVTTRSQTVADITQSNRFLLQGLTMGDSWHLFEKIVFDWREPPHPQLISIGQRILKRCAGVPLAVTVVASHLRGKTVEEWRRLEEFQHLYYNSHNNLSSLIIPTLKLSYNLLDLTLKLCFAYCSLFPEGHTISIIDLVSLWMAQGYIEPVDSVDLEDIAINNFQKLHNHAYFMDLTMDEFGNMATCKMHDLIHGLAKDVARGWGTITHLPNFQEERRVQSFSSWIAVEDVVGAARRIKMNDIVGRSSFKSLRVLDLQAFGLQVLPDSIGNLLHLRYIDLSHNEALLKLPNSITNLYHLQTLKLNSCYELEELPPNFGKLIHLRRLEIDGCEKLTFMPLGFKNLSSLRTLTRFVVGRPCCQFTCGFEALGNFNHLRGKLMIELSENWAIAAKEAKESKLLFKTRLTELEVRWPGPTKHTSKTDVAQHQLLLDGLIPPTGLKKLRIEGYRGNDFPSWARGNTLSTALPNLITVSIEGCGQCKTLPPFSCLQFLKQLTLRFMKNVQFFESSDNQSSTSESPFFPSLEELTLNSFYSLEGWWKDEARVLSNSFTRLWKLNIWSCPKLTSMPPFPRVEVLDMQNINEKLLDSHSGMTRVEPQPSMVASSSHSEISTSEPREHPQNLQDLSKVKIKSCPRLKSLAYVKSSRSLTKLVVERLDMLSSLTEVLKQLPFLIKLEVAGCKDLDLSGRCQQDSCNGCEECDAPWKLPKLTRLTLKELPKLVTLPVGLRRVKTLNMLCISACNNLRSLPQWISNLSSLQHLRLEGCQALMMLPEGLKHITPLVKVDIIECSQLMERCSEGGEDRYKIKHARVLCHKTWRYLLMSGAELPQKPKVKGKNGVVHSEDPNIHVDVTVRRQ